MLNYGPIVYDVLAKQKAGYQTTIIDLWGRVFSFQLVPGIDGGAAVTLSGIADQSSFRNHSAPYPIMTAIGVDPSMRRCDPPPSATQYELHPYEFGSWDAGVRAFSPPSTWAPQSRTAMQPDGAQRTTTT